VLGLALSQAPAEDSDAAHARQAAYARVKTAERVASQPELVRAVLAKNQVPEGPGDIQRRDKEWVANPRYALRKELTHGPCADRLRALLLDDKIVVEAFLMDSRGGLVCSTVETSDYWQGDEAKWQKTYQAGQKFFVDEPAQDASTGLFAVQLSVLVSDAGEKIGALTLTLRVPRSGGDGGK